MKPYRVAALAGAMLSIGCGGDLARSSGSGGSSGSSGAGGSGSSSGGTSSSSSGSTSGSGASSGGGCASGEVMCNGACTAGPCLTTLAADPKAPTGIAVDASNVYWTDSDSVMKVPIVGGTPTSLASGQNGPWAIAVASGYVYWTNRGSPGSGYSDGSVARMPSDGSGSPLTLATQQTKPQSLAVDGANVYWISGQTLMSVPVDGGVAATVLVSQEMPINGVALSDTSVYWTSGASPGSVMTMPKSGQGMPTRFASASALLSAIAVSSTNVCWISTANMKTESNCLPVGSPGGTPSQLLGWGAPGFLSMAVDDTAVYLTALTAPGSSNSGSVNSVPQVPPPALGTSLATGQTFPSESSVSIAVDAASVYWIADNAVQVLTPK